MVLKVWTVLNTMPCESIGPGLMYNFDFVAVNRGNLDYFNT